MATIGSLIAKIGIDNAGLIRGLNKTEKMLNSFASVSVKGFKKITSAVFSLKTAILGIITSYALKEIAQGFITVGDSVNKLKLSLDTITKGEGEIWFAKLNQWASDMPINTEKAIKAFTSMRAMGMQPTIDDMTTLVDTVSALGGGVDVLEGIARALGQIQTKGKVATQELYQLAERGIPAMEILSDELGLTSEQLGDIGNQGVEAGKAIEALLKGMQERFGGLSAKIMETWSGMIEQMNDSWYNFRKDVMAAGVMEAIEAGLKNVISAIDDLKSDTDSYNEVVARTAKFIINSIANVVNALPALGQGFAWILEQVIALAGSGLVLLKNMVDLATVLAKINPFMSNEEVASLEQWSENLDKILIGTAGAANSFDNMQDKIETLSESIREIASTIRAYGDDVDETVKKNQEFADSVSNVSSEGIEALAKFNEEINKQITIGLGESGLLRNSISTYTQTYGPEQDFADKTDEYEEYLKNIYNSTVDFFRNVLDGEISSVKDLLNVGLDYMKDVAANVFADMAKDFVMEMSSGIKEITSKLAGMFDGVLGIVVGVGTLLASEIKDVFDRKSYSVKGSSLLGDIDFHSESITNALSLLEEVNADSLSELKGIYQEMLDLNKNLSGATAYIVEGFGDFDVSLGDVTSKFRDFADKLTAGAWTSVFGGQKTRTVESIGLETGGVSIADLLEGIDANTRQFAEIKTTTSGGWFHSDKTSYSMEYYDVNEDIQNVFNEIFTNIGNTLLGLAQNFGEDTIQDVLSYAFDVSNIDLTGLSTDEIQQALTEWASEQADTAVKDIFGEWLTSFQELNEGLLETLVRLTTELQAVNESFSMIGLSNWGWYGDAEKLLEMADELVNMFGGLDEFSEAVGNFYTNFLSKSEQFAYQKSALEEAIGDIPETREGYANLVRALATLQNKSEGLKELYVTVLQLADVADAYYDAIESRTEIYEDIDSYMSELRGTYSDLAQQINSVNEYFEDQIQALTDLGEAESNLAEIRADQEEAIGILINEYADSFVEASERIREGYENFVAGLYTSEVAPVQSADYFTSEFERLLSTTTTEEDLSDLYNFFQNEYLPFMQAYTGLNEDYATLFEEGLDAISKVQIDLGDLDDNQDLADKIAEALNERGIPVSIVDGEQKVIIELDGREIADLVIQQSETNANYS